MRRLDMTIISKTYDNMLVSGSNDAERVGWGSVDSQQERFRILTEIGDLNNSSVLDVGCGLGSFQDYIDDACSNCVYTGVDINHNMIQEARKRHPSTEFIQADIASDVHILKDRKFDYVFLSGALNLSADSHKDSIDRIVKEMFVLSNKGVAVNFLSMFSDYLAPGEYYCNPEVILQLAFSITKSVVLRHDYMSHDFTIYLYK